MGVLRSLVLFSLLAIGLSGCASARPSGEPTELKLENLLQMPMNSAFAPDREVIVSLVEIPADTVMERHWHPGEEFHYYLEGEVEIRIQGEAPFIGKPGTVGHVPFMTMHTAAAGEGGAKVLVFRVHTKGMPVRFLESGGSSER